MKFQKFEIGDKVWFADGREDLVGGTVVHKFVLPGGAQIEHYVIEVETHIDPYYEVRTCWEMSPDATGPINMWRRPDPS
jgi:hypothetical protein